MSLNDKNQQIIIASLRNRIEELERREDNNNN